MKNIFTVITFFLITLLFLFAQAPLSGAQAEDTQSAIKTLQDQIAALQEKISTLNVAEPQSVSSANKFDRDLFRGQESEEVRTLQEFLAKDPSIYPEGLVTGFFGSLTEKAVQRFQEKHGIVSAGAAGATGYGRVGPKTRTKLNELLANVSGKQDQAVTTPMEIALPPDDKVTGSSMGQATTTPAAATSAATSSEPVASSALETAPKGVVEKPAPDIKFGTGSVTTGSTFGFGTGAIHYKELGRLTESGGFYGGTTAGVNTSPTLFFANVSTAKASGCDPHDAVALPEAIGPTSICNFTDAAAYTFRSAELVRFHEKSSSCYEGLILFRQNGLYGGIEPEDVTKQGHLMYRYWYDASGGSDFSTVCTVGKQKNLSPALASALHALVTMLDDMQDKLKNLTK
ncbi:MAG: peptidoglycan-binding protein [Patescibacteria group bacterium]